MECVPAASGCEREAEVKESKKKSEAVGINSKIYIVWMLSVGAEAYYTMVKFWKKESLRLLVFLFV